VPGKEGAQSVLAVFLQRSQAKIVTKQTVKMKE